MPQHHASQVSHASYAPDNGAGGPPCPLGDDRRLNGDRQRREVVGYHAVSKNGLDFTRVEDVRLPSAPVFEGHRRWLGNAQSNGREITNV